MNSESVVSAEADSEGIVNFMLNLGLVPRKVLSHGAKLYSDALF